MLTFTPRAREAVRAFMDDGLESRPAVRITLSGGSPLAPRYGLALVDPQDIAEGEVEFSADEVRVLVSERSVPRLEGATVDFVEGEQGSGFQIRDLRPPPVPPTPSGPIADRVQRILDEQINPGIAAHGGVISLVAVEGTEIHIEMSGGCQGCALSRMTLRQGVERMIRQSVPEVTAIHDVTDHASGQNPYYER